MKHLSVLIDGLLVVRFISSNMPRTGTNVEVLKQISIHPLCERNPVPRRWSAECLVRRSSVSQTQTRPAVAPCTVRAETFPGSGH